MRVSILSCACFSSSRSEMLTRGATSICTTLFQAILALSRSLRVSGLTPLLTRKSVSLSLAQLDVARDLEEGLVDIGAGTSMPTRLASCSCKRFVDQFLGRQLRPIVVGGAALSSRISDARAVICTSVISTAVRPSPPRWRASSGNVDDEKQDEGGRQNMNLTHQLSSDWATPLCRPNAAKIGAILNVQES